MASKYLAKASIVLSFGSLFDTEKDPRDAASLAALGGNIVKFIKIWPLRAKMRINFGGGKEGNNEPTSDPNSSDF